MGVFSIKELLEGGVHFGHQAKRWNPRMKNFLYTERNGIHIINLQITLDKGQMAYEFIRDNVAKGAKVLFVGTKKQAQQAIEQYAKRCGAFYVNHRWLGGLLTNFSTIKSNVERLKKLEKMEIDGIFDSLTKKERLKLKKHKDKLEHVIGGIKEMTQPPDILFVVDTLKENIAILEARKMNIPVIGIVDSNSNPDLIQYPIPGNDDAIRAINLFLRVMSDAILEGEMIRSKKVVEEFKMQEDESETIASMNDESIKKSMKESANDEATKESAQESNNDESIKESDNNSMKNSNNNGSSTLGEVAVEVKV